MRRRDDRSTAGHRLGDRHPEALEARRVDDGRCAAVEACELLVGDTAEPHDPAPVELGLVAPPRSACDREHELEIGEKLERLDERLEVLARLERRNREQVREPEIGRLPVEGELGTDPWMRDERPLPREAESAPRNRRP